MEPTLRSQLSPAAQRSLDALEALTDRKREFAAKALGRAILKAYDAVLDARYANAPIDPRELDTEEKIEAEATRMTKSVTRHLQLSRRGIDRQAIVSGENVSVVGKQALEQIDFGAPMVTKDNYCFGMDVRLVQAMLQ
jgi:DNA-binding protein